MAEYKSKVLIIGSGPAGYTAGIYASRAGLAPILVTGNQSGGQLTITTEVENFPGFATPINGSELMNNMHLQAQNVGVKIIDDLITEVDFSKRPFICNSEKNNIYSSDSIIIATGASARWLGLENETKYRGYGVSGCATCDGFFYRNRNVAVVGGGNTAAEEALYLSNFAKSVTLIHRRDNLRADKILQKKVLTHPKIHIEWDTIIEDILGTDNPRSVTGLRLKNIKNDNIFDISIDGLFVAIGHHPNTEIFKHQLHLDNNAYIITKHNSCQTNIEGVYAAGDVMNSKFRQAIIAAGSGCLAALEVEKFLNK